MIDYLEEIDSDLSVFHRVDDPEALSAPRFLKLVRQLHHYDGALRHALRAAVSPEPVAAQAAPAPGMLHLVPNATDTSPEVLAQMSSDSRFPGVEYDG